jgi:PKHD-type hydroxylase
MKADYSPRLLTGVFDAAKRERLAQLPIAFRTHTDTFYLATAAKRASHSAVIPVGSSTTWLYELLADYRRYFAQQFAFELSGEFEDPVLMIRYETGGQLDWHIDSGGEATEHTIRKISLTIQLSDGDDYAGGDLEFLGGASSALFRRAGTVIGFPSFIAHRVTPVTSGTRLALVAFATGANFK